MEEREYRKIKKGVEVYEKLKKILPTKRCIEQVIRHIYTLELSLIHISEPTRPY